MNLPLALHYSAIQWQLGRKCTLTLVWSNTGSAVQILALYFDSPHQKLRRLEITPTLQPKLVARALLATTILEFPPIENARP